MSENIVPQSVRDALILKACQRNTPAEVMILGSEAHTLLKSRFLRGPSEDDGHSIALEMPTTRGTAFAAHPDDSAQILMMVEGQRYGFDSIVLARSRVKLAGDIEVSALEVAYPDALVKLQRRRYYRTRTPPLAPIMASCTARNPKPKSPGDEYVRLQTPVIDISCGGMALRVPRKHRYLAAPGARWASTFYVPGSREPVKLLVEIRHLKPVTGSKDLIAGCMYVDWGKTLEGRRAINSIARYVAHRQREELRKLSGLE